MHAEHPHAGGTAAVAFGTLGIVFGDIGTSPLYAFRESFEHADLAVTTTNAYGVASIVFWALVIVICVKYLMLVMRADNHGEGGILALTALILPTRGLPTGTMRVVVAFGVFGTALLYGDGLITPAISVLSAVEGFEVATDTFADWTVPMAIAIIVGLFLLQQRGTERISRVFSPVMVLWFVVLGGLGLRHIVDTPEVLRAVWPGYALDFLANEPGRAFLALGSIILVVTGGEALYADMGHFGRRPIQHGWYAVVLPALTLNYFGQAALLSTDPAAVESPFFRLAPDWAITPLAVLATVATVIASQALITGAFSLTVQAVRLDYLPRLAIQHTSPDHIGQVYVPLVNWLLMIGCVGLVLGFQTSSNLASAYGLAVTMTMTITTLLFFRVAVDRWRWSRTRAVAVVAPLLFVDLAFLSANIPKIPTGGWFPLVVGLALVVQMTTWRRGRALVAARLRHGQRPLPEFAKELVASDVTRVPGLAVYLTKEPGRTPPALESNLEHHHVLHETTVVLSVRDAEVPRIALEDQIEVSELAAGIHQVVLTFGFLQRPDVVGALGRVELDGRPLDPAAATYFVGRESVTAGKAPGMGEAREQLFVLLNRGAASASRFFDLPPERVVEVGTQVEI